MKNFLHRICAQFIFCVLLLVPLGTAWAQLADIATVPLVGASTGGAPPNIMLLVDTSNSMSWTHMPDQLEAVGAKQSIGYKASECNALYYNRNRTYTVPFDAANAALPTPAFNSAPKNYYIDAYTNNGVITYVDLSKNFQAHDDNTVQNVGTSVADTPQAAYYFYFTPSSGVTPTYAYNSSPCNVADDSTKYVTSKTSPVTTTVAVSGVGTWTRVLVSSNSGPAGNVDERANFAIWYTYYRTRINLAKSSIGLAFESLSNTYRVGFLTVNPTLDSSNNPTSTVQSGHYTPISDFNSAQRTLWYNNFYGQKPAGSSPSREGLARVGRHYAGKTDGINSGMNFDPVQYACQKNFTIMTTDGYWNVAAEKAGLSGGPTNVDGTASVGEQDGGSLHPMTLDSNPNGLVPAGVFDGTLSQIGYTKTGSTTTTLSYPSCNVTVPAYKNTTVSRTVTPQVKTVVVTPGNNSTQWQSQQVSYKKTSYLMTKQTLQYVIATQNQITTQLAYYDATKEQTLLTDTCTGKSNCGPTALTVTTAVPSGTCKAQPADSTTNYISIVCQGATSAIQTSACTVGSNGCAVNTIVPPTFVAGNACSAGNSGSPNYYITSCTTNAPGTASPSTTASASTVVANIAACTTSYSAAGNLVCSNASGYPTAFVANTGCPGAAGVNAGNTITTVCQNTPICVSSSSYSCTTTTTTTPNPVTIGGPGVACTGGSTTDANGTVTTTTCSTPSAYSLTTGPLDPLTCPIGTTNPGSNAPFQKTVCASSTSAAVAGACQATGANASNGFVAKSCTTTTTTGWYPSSQTTTNETWTYDNGTVVPQTPVVAPAVSLGSCQVLPAPALVKADPVPTAPVYVPYSATGGSTNSLADVAQYYYVTDLRPTMSNIVPPSGSGPLDDKATWQHMTTYVVGLGVSGTLPYQANYATSGTGSFANIRALTQSWPVWPDPTITYVNNDLAWNSPKSIDDFWHTAVNGRGKYFSAGDPSAVVSGIQTALQSINANTGSSTADTISDQLNVTNTGLNFASSYTTVDWTGDVQAFDSSNLATVIWSAQQQVDAQRGAACDNRNIYVRTGTGTSKLGAFTVSTKNCLTGVTSTSLSSSLQTLISTPSLTQYATMNAAQKGQDTVAARVNFLRGQTQNEGYATSTSGALYRSRKHALSDIVNSKPQFVGAPYVDYADDGYYAFKTANATRQNMIYVGGNDGMLHAIYAPPATASSSQLAVQGQEAWAYIPTQVISSMSYLADVNYSSNHRFYVDATPTVGDVKFADGSWHTVLVGGLGAGGKGYYALDITDPSAPVSLWEFDSSNCGRTGCSVGYTFGPPIIGKMADGTWAVFMSSGYNNSTGQAALFVVNAQTGATIKTINAGTASSTSPLNFAAISGWTELPSLDRTISRVYGGDLHGNIWRFEVNSSTTDAVYLLGVAKDVNGNTQPVTMPPELGKVGANNYVYVGTGRLIGASDFANTQPQTVYAIHDTLALSNSTVDLRSVLTPYVTTSSLTIACATSCTTVSDSGYLIDLAGSGEKVITPLALVGTTLAIISSQPQDNTCGSGGTSKVYFADATNGTTVATGIDLLSTVVGVIYLNSANQTVIGNVRFGSSSATPASSSTPTGPSTPTSNISGGGMQSFTVPTNPKPSGFTRASWSEIIKTKQ
jgi:Tfp pilus tip-associated adhesin PilY1